MTNYSEADIVSKFEQELLALGINVVRHQQNLPLNYNFKSNRNSRPDLNFDILNNGQLNARSIILVEVKADIKNHTKCISQLEGYMKNIQYLGEDIDVIGIALSGEGVNRKLDTLVKLSDAKEIENVNINIPLTSQQYYDQVLNASVVQAAFNLTQQDIVNFSKQLGDDIRALGVDVANFSLLVSGIMLCLDEPTFRSTYSSYTDTKMLLNHMKNTITSLLNNRQIPFNKVSVVTNEYEALWNSTSLQNQKVSNILSVVFKVYRKLYLSLNHKQDTLGLFYSQFLKYGASNQKNLGIVLTPEHCAEFMVELAGLTVDSRVLDTCCGTGSFLITAMNKILNMVNNNEAKRNLIKSKQIMGIELHNKIYTLCVVNMILRGDGHSNLFNDDCLERPNHQTREYIKGSLKPNTLIINPPYALKNADEWEFMLQGLELIEPNGLMVAIVPMSKCIANKRDILRYKERLLENHTLEAVFSMPDNLFVDVAAVTAVLVIRAHQPHPKSKSTFFGYLKEDGFYTNKSQRIEKHEGAWEAIKETMMNAYHSKSNILELSVNKIVKFDDEWCAEAHLECLYTDTESIDASAKEAAIYELIY